MADIHQITDRERELAAENERLKAELGNLPEAQAEMLATIKKLREAAKLGLEALNVATTPLAKDRQEVLRAIAALKEALGEKQ